MCSVFYGKHQTSLWSWVFSKIKDCYYPISIILTFSESLWGLCGEGKAACYGESPFFWLSEVICEKQRREWGSGGGWGRGGRKGGGALYRLLMDKSYLSPPVWMWISESRCCSLEPYWHCIVKSLFRRDTTTQSPCDITSPEDTEHCQCICMYASNLFTTALIFHRSYFYTLQHPRVSIFQYIPAFLIAQEETLMRVMMCSGYRWQNSRPQFIFSGSCQRYEATNWCFHSTAATQSTVFLATLHPFLNFHFSFVVRT